MSSYKKEMAEHGDECPICLDEMKMPYALPCKHKLHYLCVKEAYEKHNRACPLCRAPIPPSVYDAAVLVDKPKWDEYKWFYGGKTGGWWAYDDEHQEEIEEGYQKYLKALDAAKKLEAEIDSKDDEEEDSDSDSEEENPDFKLLRDAWHRRDAASYVKINILGKEYIINFEKMTQRLPGTKIVRKIKRDVDRDRDVVKGISGMRLA